MIKVAAFSLTEVVIALGLVGLTSTAIIYGYASIADKARWSAYSLAAQSIAIEGVEQARAAQWNPLASPSIDELGVTNFVQTESLDPAGAGGCQVLATNYVSVQTVSSNPPLRQIRVDCVWVMPGRGRRAGLFTNTVVTLRTSDQ